MPKNPKVDAFMKKLIHPMKAELEAVRTKKHVQLLFHTGATIEDPGRLLEGDGRVARYVNFSDMAEIRKKKKALQGVVKAWVRMKRDG